MREVTNLPPLPEYGMTSYPPPPRVSIVSPSTCSSHRDNLPVLLVGHAKTDRLGHRGVGQKNAIDLGGVEGREGGLVR